jgi:Domain of unknown function (DUF4959)
MKKKILIMVTMLFMLIPFGSASAYEGGFLHGKSLFLYTSDSIYSSTRALTDGDTSTLLNLYSNDREKRVVYTFSSKTDVKNMKYNVSSPNNVEISFYSTAQTDQNNTSGLMKRISLTDKDAVSPVDLLGVRTVIIHSDNSNPVYMYEFDLFGDSDITPPGNVTGLTATPKNGAVQLNWTNPTDSDFSALNIYRDGQKVVYKLSSEFDSRLMSGLINGETYNFKVTTVDNDGNESSGVTVTVTPNNSDVTAPGEITNINADPGEETIKFTYTLPTDSDFSHLKIYRDSELIEGSYKTGSFTDEGLSPNTEYQYKFVSVDTNGNESNGVTKTVSTFVPLKDISNLKADPDYNRVDLSWKLPQSTEFKHVNIYRDEVAEEPGFFQQLFAGASVSAAEEPTKIFETNGTYFNDLTVAPETTYEYKLTSQSTTGEETDGVTVQATTTEEPAPEMGESGYTITPEGDYLYKWDSPTEGQVKVNIAGTEYKTVEASEGQIIIPKDQMKYTIFGDPDIRLYPVSPYGKEGEPYDSSKLFKDGMMPFGGQDLLKTGMSLLGVVGPLVLLGLSFLLFPKIRKIIFNSFSKWKERRG